LLTPYTNVSKLTAIIFVFSITIIKIVKTLLTSCSKYSETIIFRNNCRNWWQLSKQLILRLCAAWFPMSRRSQVEYNQNCACPQALIPNTYLKLFKQCFEIFPENLEVVGFKIFMNESKHITALNNMINSPDVVSMT